MGLTDAEAKGTIKIILMTGSYRREMDLAKQVTRKPDEDESIPVRDY